LPQGNREKEREKERKGRDYFLLSLSISLYYHLPGDTSGIQNEAGKGIAGMRESGKIEQPDTEFARGEREWGLEREQGKVGERTTAAGLHGSVGVYPAVSVFWILLDVRTRRRVYS
jgi:hypothetical protein